MFQCHSPKSSPPLPLPQSPKDYSTHLCLFCCLTYTVTVQFSSVAQSCPTLCNAMNRTTPGLPVHHHLPEFTQTNVHLNEEFQRIPRRDKKAFFSDQCKEIEENNRLGKTRDLFKKIRDTKGTFHAKMGLIKSKNGLELTEAEDIKKRWQEYTEKLYRKDLHDPDSHDDVITNLEPDILECEVKWALGSITMNKASEGDIIPIELFQTLKDNAVNVLHSIYQQIWNTQ